MAWATLTVLIAVMFTAGPAHAALSATELAKIAQNPVGNLISIPFQNNTNLNFGPEKKTQNVLNIQPVIPVSVSSEWNVINRTILPVISMPALSPADGEQWTVPLGGGVGKIFHFGKLPVNTQLSDYYNVVKPEYGPNWQIRAQVQLMFPE